MWPLETLLIIVSVEIRLLLVMVILEPNSCSLNTVYTAIFTVDFAVNLQGH